MNKDFNIQERNIVNHKELNPANGFLMLFILIAGLIGTIILGLVGIAYTASHGPGLGLALMFVAVLLFIGICICFGGLRIVGPNEALVLTLFGKYYGTIMKPGFFFVNPFSNFNNPNYKGALESDGDSVDVATVAASIATKGKSATASVNSTSRNKKTISLKEMTLNNGTQKVNDVMGNPVIVSANVIWRVIDPTKAVFNVENFTEFLSIQTDTTIRNIARLYPYDTFDDTFGILDEDDHNDGQPSKSEQTLRGSSQEIAERMQIELQERVEFAGILIEDVRLTHIAYAEEIAAAMLQRQQASAIIAARTKIVDGAVGMVKMAIDKLNEDEICLLDEERKAQMVSNLLVVLCSGKDAQPVVNSSSIY